jgi:hypothetical protein
VANPDNITLRSEKGSYLTFEDMDLNLLELQNQITEYTQFLTNNYNPLVDSFNDIQTEWSDFQINIVGGLNVVQDDIDIINNDQVVQDNRLDQAELDITGLQLGGGLTHEGNWSSLQQYDIGSVVTYTDGLDYISVSNNNSAEPSAGVNTASWIVFTSKAIAALTTFDDSGSAIITADNVQDAIAQISNAAVSDFASPVYGSRGSAFTAVSNGWYALDVTSSGVPVTLPVTPSDGDTIEFFLSKGDFSANNVTINRSGQTIEGLAENMLIDSNFPRSFSMTFNGTTWRIK